MGKRQARLFDVDDSINMVKKQSRRSKISQTDQVVVPIQPNLKKSFNIKDLKKISPLTANQTRAFEEWENGQHIVMQGYAGCGKSFLALYLALRELLEPDSPYKKIVIIRSIVQTRNIGFLPGTEEEKMSPYEAPYKAICSELFRWGNSYDNLKELGHIQFECSSFLRGTTFNDSLIIIDETQNMTDGEASTVLTRVGNNSRIIVCGDDLQNDIGKESGFMDVIPILRRMYSVSFVDFSLDDIVRSGFVKDFLYAKYGMKNYR